MLDLVAIGKFIAQLRQEKNMSQQELADALYVTHQAVSKWEKGKSVPNIEVMVTLTKFFNITIDQLLACNNINQKDFASLLASYSREYVINQLILGNLDFKIEQVLYLLSNEERDVIISHVLNQHLKVNISDLLPYLNPCERKRIVLAIKDKRLNININEISHMLTKTEKFQICGGKIYGY